MRSRFATSEAQALPTLWERLGHSADGPSATLAASLASSALTETKHIATHRDVGRWDHYTQRWTNPEAGRRLHKDFAAAAVATALAGTLSRRLTSLLALGERYLNDARAAQVAQQKLAGATTHAEVLARVRARETEQMAMRKFRSAMESARTELRKTYRQNFRAGMADRGVRTTRVSGEDKRWVDSAAQHEVKFFTNLTRDLQAGRSAKALAPRIELYGKAAASAFFAGQVIAAGGDQKIHWISDPSLENCPDCLELEAQGPYTRDNLPTTPRAGATRCLSRCGCRLEFEDVPDEEIDQLNADGLDKNYLLRRITGPRKGRTSRA